MGVVFVPLRQALILLQEPPAVGADTPYDFIITIVTGNFGLTVVLLVFSWRCLRWLERETERKKDDGP